MKEEGTVDESPQSELEIHQIVEKARRRRHTDRKRSPTAGLEATPLEETFSTDLKKQPHANGVNGTVPSTPDKIAPPPPSVYELGIAEVPKPKVEYSAED